MVSATITRPREGWGSPRSQVWVNHERRYECRAAMYLEFVMPAFTSLEAAVQPRDLAARA